MKRNDFVSVQDLTEKDVNALIDRALAFEQGAHADLTGHAACNLFFEPSTRTFSSFTMAEARLNLINIPFDAGSSSLTKGETLEDSLKTLAAIGVEVAVIRHPADDYYTPLIEAGVPLHLVNAGSGAGQHPSQTMLDLMTIRQEFGRFAGLTVGIAGDLVHSRVAHSDAQLLKALGARIIFAGPPAWHSPEFEVLGTYVETDELVAQADVVMLLRVQHERIQDLKQDAFDAAAYHAQYGLTLARAEKMQAHAIIMHPAPVNRGVELADALVEAPQSRIFTQMRNGMFMRMAILERVLTQQEEIHANSN